MAEFEERFNSEEDIKIDTCDGGSEVRKRFCGVTKAGNRWRARIRHPKHKLDVSLGSYTTHEEAVLVVKKKKAEFEELLKGENRTMEETCWDEFEGRKLPYGVTRRAYGRWGASIRHPKLKPHVRLGSYNSPEEAAFVVDEKKAEFLSMYEMSPQVKPDYKYNDTLSEIEIMPEIPDKPTGGLKVSTGVMKLKSGKWCARIRDPKTRARIWLGIFNTAKDAVRSLYKCKAELAAKRKREEFEEDVKIETSNDVSEVRKRFCGVTKEGNRWRARTQHPKLKFEVSLGSYTTHEEAVLVVQNKKAEFVEMYKGENSMNVETCKDDFEGRKLPYGVTRRGYGRWGASIWHPALKRQVRLGSYSTPEEAAFVVHKKRTEFLKMYGWSPKVKPDCEEFKHNDLSLEKPKRDLSDELPIDQEVPSGVRKLKSGKWVARIRETKTRARIWLGRFDTVKEAIKALNKGKTELATKRKRDEFDWMEFRANTMPGIETNEGPMKIECAADLNNIASLPDKLECKFVQCSPTSGFEPENSNSAVVGDTSVIRKENVQKSGCVYGFEEATSLGFINEYGQLVGGYTDFNERIDTCDGSTVRKRFRGVTKTGNRWRARIQHPKLKFEVSLGSYTTYEEAALAVKKKRAEFEEMLKEENSKNKETCGDGFEGRKLPVGVSRRGYGRWGAQILHPKSKRYFRLGSYSTPEEAALVLDRKRAEFLKMYGWSPKFQPDCKGSKDNEFFIEEPERDVSNELSDYQEGTSGVTKLKSWKWSARIRDPKPRARNRLETFNIGKEAVKFLNKAEDELVAKRNRSEFDGLEFWPKARPGFEANEGPMKIECAADLNNIARVPAKLERSFVFEPGNSNKTDVGDTSLIREENEHKGDCVFKLDEAMSLGIINEYGQLVGEYSELDEQLGFSAPDEVAADVGYYGFSL